MPVRNTHIWRPSKSLSPKARVLVDAFKQNNAAEYLASTSAPDAIPRFNGLPEVIVAGRANVGKSTFLNALMNRANLVHTGKKAGRTRSLNFYRVGREPGALILVDSPGYGAKGRTAWGTLWDRYVDTRKELRAIFILINTPHGVTDFDRAMLEDLNERLLARASESLSPRSEVPILQPIFTKIDRVEGDEDKTIQCIEKVKEIAPISASPILCAVGPSLGIGLGILAARVAIYSSDSDACTFEISRDETVDELREQIRVHVDFKKSIGSQKLYLYQCGEILAFPDGSEDPGEKCRKEWLREKKQVHQGRMVGTARLRLYFEASPATVNNRLIDIVVVTDSLLISIRQDLVSDELQADQPAHLFSRWRKPMRDIQQRCFA